MYLAHMSDSAQKVSNKGRVGCEFGLCKSNLGNVGRNPMTQRSELSIGGEVDWEGSAGGGGRMRSMPASTRGGGRRRARGLRRRVGFVPVELVL